MAIVGPSGPTLPTKAAAAAETADPLADWPILADHGYTPESVATATDTEILALPGIGPAALNRIRQALENG